MTILKTAARETMLCLAVKISNLLRLFNFFYQSLSSSLFDSRLRTHTYVKAYQALNL